MNRLGRWWVAVVLVLVGCGGGGSNDGGPVDCSALACTHGQCVSASGGPRCLCDEGFVSRGNACVAGDPCDGVSCAALSGSHCEATDAGTSCVCEAGRIAVNGACTGQNACLPNPCLGEHQTSCEVSAGQATCRCDPGYVPEGSGCSATSVFDCGRRHSTGDNAEPDECPMLAKVLPYGVALERTLEPAGDHDWFKLAVLRDDVVSVTAGNQTMPLILEVFDTTGTRVLASDTRGVLDPQTAFLATSTGTVYVRVRGVRATDTGEYLLSALVVGADDYANDGVGAQHLTPGPHPLEGTIQYPGDVDAVWYALPAGEAWRFTSAEQSDAGPTDVVIELQRIDGGTAVITDLGVGVTVLDPEEVLVRARGRNAQRVGGFSIAMEWLGTDDYSDTPQVGPLLTPGVRVTGRLERLQDVDGLRMEVVEGHVYAPSLTTTTTSYNTVTLTVTDETSTLFSSNYYSGLSGFKAARSGVVFLSVTSPYSYGTPTDWTLKVEDLGTDDFTNTAPGAPISLGQPQTGRFELNNDVDVFRFSALAQRVIRVAISPLTAANGVPISVTDANGASVVSGSSPLQFFATAAGDYDVALSNQIYGSTVASYTITVTDVGTDDFTGTGPSATSLTIGTAQAGSIQYQGDTDEFAFTAVANHVYDVDPGLGSGSGGGSLSVTVTSPAGTVSTLPWYGYGGTPAFLATNSGRYVLTLSGNSYNSTTQAYSLTVRDRGLEDHGPTAATATPVTAGTPIAGRIGFSQDVDAFRVTATAARIYTARVTPTDVQLQVIDPGGQALNSYSYGGTVSFRATSSGAYTVLATGYSYSSASTNYTLTITDDGADDFGDTDATASALTVGTPVTGVVQFAEDVDVFAVSLNANQFYEVACVAQQSCIVEVVTANGTQLGSSYYSSTISFVSTTAGTVYVRVRGNSGSTLTYSLRVNSLGTDDFGDTRATAGSLPTTGASVSGAISVLQDIDAFTIAVTAGQILRIGCATSTSGTGVCRMSLKNANDVVVAQSDYGENISVRVAQGGTWLLTVSSSGYSSTPAFTYDLQANQVVDDHGDTTATATVLPLGALMPGSIDYTGDVDVFAFTATSTSALTFRITGNSSYQLQIRNAAGGIVAGLTTWDTWTPPTTGTWYLWLTAPGTQSNAYSVQVQ